MEKTEQNSHAETDAVSEPLNGAANETTPDPLEVAQNEAKEWEKKFLYLTAEFENYRKRMQKERSDFLKWGHEDFLRDQLLVRDNFERAVDHARSIGFEKATPFGQVVLGVEMILQQFSDSLKNQGVQEIQTVGKKFDPLQHEAVMQEDSETAEQDTVLRDLQKGYVLHGRLLRAARVVTACAKKTV
jgi:molecular chaperone GrpE